MDLMMVPEGPSEDVFPNPPLEVLASLIKRLILVLILAAVPLD